MHLGPGQAQHLVVVARAVNGEAGVEVGDEFMVGDSRVGTGMDCAYEDKAERNGEFIGVKVVVLFNRIEHLEAQFCLS